MRIRFWGVRGSIPTPCTTSQIEQKIVHALLGAAQVDLTDRAAVEEYVRSLPLPDRGTWGGNTSCTEVRTEAGDLLIIDAGSGLRALGVALMPGEFGRGQGRADFLVSHTHWDHLQGWPFFTPLYIPGNRFVVYGCHEDLEERFRLQQDRRFFPVSLDGMAATIEFVRLTNPAELCEGRVRLFWMEVDHPGRSFTYKIEADGKTFIYASDAEYKELSGSYYERCVEFYRGADALLFDAQYLLHETLAEKYNWGHSSALIGVDIAAAAGVKRLILSHHEPLYDDHKIDQIFQDAFGYARQRMNAQEGQVLVAYEGLELQV
jgi:phosphoribosyl 1,2-cyclic phosphodiesterase